ncbi:CorA metal ion transporter [Allomyces javanicus]|nr:CorA metal ion transporter [Allomyces javanicus]
MASRAPPPPVAGGTGDAVPLVDLPPAWSMLDPAALVPPRSPAVSALQRDDAASMMTGNLAPDLAAPAVAPTDAAAGPGPAVDFALLMRYLAAGDGDAARLVSELAAGEDKGMAQDAYFTPAFDPAAKFTFVSASTGLVQGATLASVRTHLTGRADTVEPFWLDVYAPRDVDVAILARIVGIHPLTAEDMTTDEAREKCEAYDDYLFLCLKTVADDDATLAGVALREAYYYVVLMPQCVISVRHEPLRHPADVARRLLAQWAAPRASSASARSVMPTRAVEPDWVAYAILDDIIDALRPIIKALEFDVDGIDDLAQILPWSEQGDLLARMRRAAKRVTQLIRLLHFKDEVVRTLGNRGAAFLSPETRLYLRDIQDHILTLQHSLAIARETVNAAHTGYLSQLSVDMSQVSNETNALMKRISMLGSLFLPMTFVTGLFGMNIHIPGQNTDTDDPNYIWFWGIVGSMIAMAVIVGGIAMRLGYM